ncbi:S-adenosyl-L-methionine-dependent methyltransferase [Ramicandelaber brevisporus]|nr:S-adenosyl-L-methionine-dependent methyltransferase [Ramicandelaber brevisporus]
MLKVCEFYSGIGGMHFALERSGVPHQVIAAFDVNDVANKVYAHNFPGVKIHPRLLESQPASFFAKLGADVWVMSPPCQPYTRQGNQLGSEDRRANSFLHLIEVIGELGAKGPSMVLVENVYGFEKSHTRDALVIKLKQCGYEFREFMLTPLQFGVPNSRLRYYLVAWRSKDVSVIEHSEDSTLEVEVPPLDLLTTIPGMDRILPLADVEHIRDKSSSSPSASQRQLPSSIAPVSDYLIPISETDLERYRIAERVLEKTGYAFDIVSSLSQRTCCFTKGYFHYVEGTGSILRTDSESAPLALPLPRDKLRYFHEYEIAALMGFPTTAMNSNNSGNVEGGERHVLKFPEDITQKQRYRLLGNSLSVLVVSHLLKFVYSKAK